MMQAAGPVFAAAFLGGFMTNSTNASAGMMMQTVQPSERATMSSDTTGCVGASCTVTCHWWEPEIDGRQTDTSCDATTMLRQLTRREMEGALARATACAEEHGVSCVLSHEVGYRLPAAMLWDPSSMKMRLIMMPTVSRQFENATADRKQRVSMITPSTQGVLGPYQWMRYAVRVRSMETTMKESLQEILEGPEAFCVQALLLSVPEDCDMGVI